MIDINRLAYIAERVAALTGLRAIVAGGAVRDTLNARSVKDIDVLVELDRSEETWTDHSASQALVRKIAAEFSDGADYATTSESGYEGGDEQVYATYDVPSPVDGRNINVIFVNNIEAALNEFPDTISQVYVGADGIPQGSEEYTQGQLSKEILHVLDSTIPRQAERLNRLAVKYPEYVFVGTGTLPYWE